MRCGVLWCHTFESGFGAIEPFAHTARAQIEDRRRQLRGKVQPPHHQVTVVVGREGEGERRGGRAGDEG